EAVGGGGDAVPQGPPPATGGLGRHLGRLDEAVAREGHQVLAGAAHAHAELPGELLGSGVASAAQGVEHGPAPCRERRRRAGLIGRAHHGLISVPSPSHHDPMRGSLAKSGGCRRTRARGSQAPEPGRRPPPAAPARRRPRASAGVTTPVRATRSATPRRTGPDGPGSRPRRSSPAPGARRRANQSPSPPTVPPPFLR